MFRALLIDDEPGARADLRERLDAHPQVEIHAEAGTIDRTRALLDRDDYDLVFLDIQLRGGTGFDLVPAVRPAARIVFVTAFDAYALRAFEVNALDYLLKPVHPERLAACLARLAALSGAPPVPAAARITDLVHLRLDGERQRFVPVAEISAVVSNQNYSEARLATGERLLVRKTMKSWEALLPAEHFVRVHRHSIINLAQLRGIERATDDTSLLTVHGCSHPVRASYRYLPALRARLAEAGVYPVASSCRPRPDR